MNLRQEYIYLAHTYRGHRPANRVKIEEYENGIIFGVPLFTTMHVDMMRMMQPSLTNARADATRQGAGRRTDMEEVKTLRTGRLHAVSLEKEGMGTIEKLEFADPRGLMATVTVTDPEVIDLLTEGVLHRGMSVVSEFQDVSPELFDMLVGVPHPHRPGCSHSRTGRCICDYIGQWDDK